MQRDIEFASIGRINASAQIFAREGIPHIIYDIEPISILGGSFHARIPTLTMETSNYIFHRLQQNHWLGAENYLIHNPRRNTDWQTFLFSTENKTFIAPGIIRNLRNHQNILGEFLNTVYGQHEISFERSFEALTWLPRHINKANTP